MPKNRKSISNEHKSKILITSMFIIVIICVSESCISKTPNDLDFLSLMNIKYKYPDANLR